MTADLPPDVVRALRVEAAAATPLGNPTQALARAVARQMFAVSDDSIGRRLDQLEREDGDVASAVAIARALLDDNRRLREALGVRYAEISQQPTAQPADE